jgi:hypothetical protein
VSSNKETDLRKQAYNYRVNYTMCMIRNPQYLGCFIDQDIPCSALAFYEHVAALHIAKIQTPVTEFLSHCHDVFFEPNN